MGLSVDTHGEVWVQDKISTASEHRPKGVFGDVLRDIREGPIVIAAVTAAAKPQPMHALSAAKSAETGTGSHQFSSAGESQAATSRSAH
jgi:hypothetical protein